MRHTNYIFILPTLVVALVVVWQASLFAQIPVITRSYDNTRAGVNSRETMLTPSNVGLHLICKTASLVCSGDDPRIEAQPLYVPKIRMSDGQVHDVVFVATMGDNIWAFDVDSGKALWTVNLGHPVRPALAPAPGFPTATEIDMWGVNILWGILSTPVIDLETKTLFAVTWTSPNGSVKDARFELNAINLSSGERRHPAVIITTPASSQRQRSALLLADESTSLPGVTKKTLFIGFGGDGANGWLLAYDVETLEQAAAWRTTPSGLGGGIWQSGQGPAADASGAVYIMTSNYAGRDGNSSAPPPVAGDLPESFVKLAYSAPSPTSPGRLLPVAWFMPFRDVDRFKGQGASDFQDQDLGSGAPVLTDLGFFVGAGKDGVLYVLPQDTAQLGKGSDMSRLDQPPRFFTYDAPPGFDPSQISQLDHLFYGKTHHLHGTQVFWHDPKADPMLYVWGENESLRAWKIDSKGKITPFAKSVEIASDGLPPPGGMPGGFLTLSANSGIPNTGIVWATAPVNGDANKYVVPGILRAYDASKPGPGRNADGSATMNLLWDTSMPPANHFSFSKFCPPVVADGRVLLTTYDGRVDVYSMH